MDNQLYETSYVCDNGKIAKLNIPTDATEDDLLALIEMIHIIAKRHFKIDLTEDTKAFLETLK